MNELTIEKAFTEGVRIEDISESNPDALKSGLILLLEDLLSYFSGRSAFPVEAIEKERVITNLAVQIMLSFKRLNIEDIACCFKLIKQFPPEDMYYKVDPHTVINWINQYSRRRFHRLTHNPDIDF